MNIRAIRKCLLIMLVCILPISVGVGLIFAPMTLGYSIPVAIYVLPLFCILGGLISVFFLKDLNKRRAYLKGILFSGLLWLTLCICLLTVLPFRFRIFFQKTIPGLSQFILEKEGKMIATVVNGKYEYSEQGELVSRITLEGWQTLDVGTSHDRLEMWGHFRDPFPMKDTLVVVEKVLNLIGPFLNDRGRNLIINRKINYQLIPGGYNISVFDSEARAIEMDIRIQNILVLIEKEYTLLQ